MNEQEQKVYDNDIRKIQLGAEYEQILRTPAGQDLIGYIDTLFKDAQNEIIKEQHDRSGKVGTDTLRGRLQSFSLIYQHINGRIGEAHRINNRLVENNKNQ